MNTRPTEFHFSTKPRCHHNKAAVAPPPRPENPSRHPPQSRQHRFLWKVSKASPSASSPVTYISKSGIFHRAGSKKIAQCAVVDEARDIFVKRSFVPPRNTRLSASSAPSAKKFIAYGEEKTFPADVFSAFSLEFDDRPALFAIASCVSMKKWLGNLERAARQRRTPVKFAKMWTRANFWPSKFTL